jgi:membrane-associated protease RseP (regulator of RpoE activity)
MYKRFLTAVAAGALLLFALPGLAQTEDSASATKSQGAFLGIQAQTAPSSAHHEGVIVRNVEPNSPAAKAGLRRGDIITKMANQDITDFEELDNVLSQHRSGQKMKMEVLRNGQTKQMTVTLGRRPQSFQGSESGQFGQNEQYGESGQYQRGESGQFGQSGQFQRGQSGQYRGSQSGQFQDEQERGAPGYYSNRGRQGAFLGVEAEELTPSLRQREGISARQGVVIAEVMPNSPAEQAGLQEGDVVTKVDGQTITNPDELRDAIQNAGAGQEVTLDVVRGQKHQELTAQLRRAPAQFGGESGQFYGTSPTQQGREIQRLQQRIQQLERRLRMLEQNQNQNQNWQNQQNR